MLKGKTPLVIALILAVIATALVFVMLKYRESKLLKDWELETVVVANQNILEGSNLSYDMVAKRSMPKKFVTPSVVSPEQLEKVIGQMLMAPLQKGDLVLWSHFRTSTSSEHLSNSVPKVGRAISVEIDRAESVGGFIRPNDHIDVLATFEDPNTGKPVTVTLLQNIIVLATGLITGTTHLQTLDKREQQYHNVTVMVLPEEAEILVLASTLGSLHISLRNPEDIGEKEERGRVTIETLLTGERVKALKKKREKTIQIIRFSTSGADRLEVE